jgi:hypothetical protein
LAASGRDGRALRPAILRSPRCDRLRARGDRLARDTLLRIVQRDPDAGKRDRARTLLARLDAAPAA